MATAANLAGIVHPGPRVRIAAEIADKAALVGMTVVQAVAVKVEAPVEEDPKDAMKAGRAAAEGGLLRDSPRSS
jgi:hypothetical protein